MINRHGKGRQHINILKKSTMDEISLSDAVDSRFRSLCHDYFRVKGEQLIPPSDLDAAMLLWRTMTVRHRGGDYRNTAEEYKAVKEIAEWTVKIKIELTGDNEKTVIWS